MLLLVDHLALRARNYEYLIRLFQEWEVGVSVPARALTVLCIGTAEGRLGGGSGRPQGSWLGVTKMGALSGHLSSDRLSTYQCRVGVTQFHLTVSQSTSVLILAIQICHREAIKCFI